MAISVSNANIVFKDKSGNIGKVQSLTDNDIAKISTAISTVDNHTTSLATLTSSINRVNDQFADYSTTSEINTKLASYPTTSELTSTLNNYALKSALNSYATTSSLSNYATNSTVSSVQSAMVDLISAQTISGAKTFTAELVTSSNCKALAFYATSDKNLKENLKEVNYDLSSLKTYIYNFIDDKNKVKHVGLLAQEVQKIIPDAVTVNKNSRTLVLDYNAIVAALVSEVNALKKRVSKLENK